MAEALWRKHGGDAWDVFSAGTKPSAEVHPLAVVAMAELGIDLAGQKPKSVDTLVGESFDLLITVCGNAESECPSFSGAKRRLHWPFDDPASAVGTDDERLRFCRRVRDEIDEKIKAWLVQQVE
jgi:arsenate reductase